jgi:acyl phosphate:glycerol-3-phosphate acyltransferase
LGGVIILTWLLIAALTRYSSLASIITIVCAPFYAFFLTQHNVTAVLPLVVMAMLVLYKHHDNIKRLVNGRESKINWNKK